MNDADPSRYVSPTVAQSRISRTLRSDMAVSRIAAILSQVPFDGRRALGRRICDEFPFVDAAGHLLVAGCIEAPATLADSVPEIVLPPPRAPAAINRSHRLEADVPLPVGVPPR